MKYVRKPNFTSFFFLCGYQDMDTYHAKYYGGGEQLKKRKDEDLKKGKEKKGETQKTNFCVAWDNLFPPPP